MTDRDKEGTRERTHIHISTVYHELYLKAPWLNICSNKLMFPSWNWQDKQLKCNLKTCNEEAERDKERER